MGVYLMSFFILISRIYFQVDICCLCLIEWKIVFHMKKFKWTANYIFIQESSSKEKMKYISPLLNTMEGNKAFTCLKYGYHCSNKLAILMIPHLGNMKIPIYSSGHLIGAKFFLKKVHFPFKCPGCWAWRGHNFDIFLLDDGSPPKFLKDNDKIHESQSLMTYFLYS